MASNLLTGVAERLERANLFVGQESCRKLKMMGWSALGALRVVSPQLTLRPVYCTTKCVQEKYRSDIRIMLLVDEKLSKQPLSTI